MAADDPLLAGDELPELLVLEALAQTAACVNAGSWARTRPAGGGARVAFDGRARAGDVVRSRQEDGDDGRAGPLLDEARVGERVIARGEMTFAVTVAP